MKKIKYNSKPPLRFLGNKFYTLNKLYKRFENLKLDEDTIIIDTFGGSGLLSDFFRKLYPNNKVIYNDYDGYTKRLKKISAEVLDKLRELFKGVKPKRRPTPEVAKKIYDYVINLDRDLIDIDTIISSCCLKGTVKIGEFRACSIYNKIPKTNLTIPNDWLENVEIVHKDYRELLEEFKDKKVLWIFDVPYVDTMDTTYKSGWYTGDCLEFLGKIKEFEKMVIFNSDKKPMDEIMRYYNKNNCYFDELEYFHSASKNKACEIIYYKGV